MVTISTPIFLIPLSVKIKRIYTISKQNQISHNLTLLDVVRHRIQTIGTFSPLTIGWVTVLILALIFAIVGSMGVLPEKTGFPLLAIPFWLFLVGGFALVKDITAVLKGFQIQEIGFDKALEELSTIESVQKTREK